MVAGGPFPAEKLELLNQLAVDSCDLDDGVADRVIGRPDMCRFTQVSAEYLCAAEGGSCFTPAEAEIARLVYQGPRSASGEPLFPGLAAGSELGWGGMLGPEPMSLAVDVYRYFVHKDESWAYESFDVTRDIALAQQVIGESMDSIDPEIGEFVSGGGKLLLYHGWADPGISPFNTTRYYENVVDAIGAPARDSMRLFMLPGVGHCRGGEGPDTFDSTGAIDRWVESGVAPDRIVASRLRGGEVDRTRPLCAYPRTAVYTGGGSTDDEASFVCR
jgi:feruloyl esterase